MQYLLEREAPNGRAVRGILYEVSNSGRGKEMKRFICETLENIDFIVPANEYRIAVTPSPRFKRMLPLLLNVPGRSGIRFHRGTRPEHSRGCILVSAEMEQELTARWLALQASNEPIKIIIQNGERKSATRLD